MNAKTPKTKSQSITRFQKIVTGSFYMRGLLTTVLLTVLLAGNLVAQATDQTVKSEGLTASSPTEVKLASPNGNVVVYFRLATIDGKIGCPVYRVDYQGKPALVDSRLGLYDNMRSVISNFELVDKKLRGNQTAWKPVVGEKESIEDKYEEMELTLQMTGEFPQARRLLITFRAYDSGIAFRYTIPREGNYDTFEITSEATQFVFSGNPLGWGLDYAQGDYTNALQPLKKLITGCERPLTVKLENGLFVALAEANNQDFARMRLAKCSTANDAANVGVGVTLDGRKGKGSTPQQIIFIQESVFCPTPYTMPWRVVMLAARPGELIDHSDLILNLNQPCELTNTDWIKPGKVIRDITLTTKGAKECIDFSAKYGLQYVLFDAGWYGPEFDPTSDASSVAPKLRAVLNMQEVIDYGKSKNIGIILYVNHVAMEQQLDDILPLYEKWGVAGVKYGFVNHGSQNWTRFTYDAIRKAAKHHLMVNVHDEFRSFGYERTFPNLMTSEGVHGDEGKPTPAHNAILPFTRGLAGPMDHTFCWNSTKILGTKSHQLASSTILYSPWQFLFWYDSPKTIIDEPALNYWKDLPTSWDETRVLEGDPGRRVVIARRKGTDWFIGAIAPTDGKFNLSFDFLPAEISYKAQIYTDVVGDTSGKAVKLEERSINSSSIIPLDLSSNGGMAIHLSP